MIEESIIGDLNQENENRDNITTKELLNNLLKKLLEHKISKLEKKHIEESNTLKGISKISQNIIISLDYYSHKVRKELYKIRHKNDESTHNKKKIIENNKEEKSNILNNIESLIESKDNNLDNNINNISHINNKIKRLSKSIDAKKAKELILTPEINNKEKKIKKDKNDVFSRLACKSIGNFKKHKYSMTITETSKSKNKKLNLSRKKMNNLINKKNDINIKEDTPSRPEKEKKTEKEKILKLTSTPKVKQKLKRFSQMNLDKTNTSISSNNTSRIKKMNSKGKLNLSKKGISSTELKKEERKNEEENELNNISIENKMKEIKIENVIISDKNIKNIKNSNLEENKNGVNEKLFIDEEILKNVDKDELLISDIKTDNNNDNTIKDFSIKESINTNYDNDLTKKISGDIGSSINSFNQNNDMNNIKLINNKEQNKNNEEIKEKENKKEKEKEKENSNIININNLDNIILPQKIDNFLENEKEINFSLINEPQNENENLNQELNKTIDLNLSNLSEHLSLEEKFEGHLDEVTRYLDINDLCKLMLVNKECYTTIMNILISKTEITIDILEEEITKLKESNEGINFNLVKIEPFSFSSNSSRAISLLDNSTNFNLTNFDKKISKEIFIIFGIFFIAVGKKKEYLSLITEEQKINYINNYFKEDSSLGKLIKKELTGKLFDDKTIASLYKYSCSYINIISPNRFQRINKDFAIFVFVVKNILEHIGAIEHNIKPDKEFILYNARLKYNKEILDILNGYFDKIG